MQMTGKSDRQKTLQAQRAKTTRRVTGAIEGLLERGEPVTFYSVAENAQVARSTLYHRPDLRKTVESAREESRREAARQCEQVRIEQRLSRIEKKLAALDASLPRTEYSYVSL